ncbi:hypothetical protein [Mumia zhuanghuii]|uniref:DUF2690 domain-containing protein n=2 Tax=Mumia zhuanghuii TaxID=2585211 RepID=A0A5C4MUH8_9ACTN|nr:hypothetical protein [Mumia zhuanghuii]TNC43276.1 hypothetical protein FHE65_18635 [Mumia zhuanghuii]TNC47463.1 hypothetical protein FHE65_09885 [Mumia zhuanghuii]
MTRLRTAWAAALLALLMACGAGASDAPRACTMIGSSAGIAVSVEPPLAREANAVWTSVCWDGSCVETLSALVPGQAAVDQGCDGAGPDSSCSAVMTPDGTMQGFVGVAALPLKEVEVTTVVQRRDGTELRRDVARVTPEPTYPNGKDCEPGGNQVRLTLP